MEESVLSQRYSLERFIIDGDQKQRIHIDIRSYIIRMHFYDTIHVFVVLFTQEWLQYCSSDLQTAIHLVAWFVGMFQSLMHEKKTSKPMKYVLTAGDCRLLVVRKFSPKHFSVINSMPLWSEETHSIHGLWLFSTTWFANLKNQRPD